MIDRLELRRLTIESVPNTRNGIDRHQAVYALNVVGDWRRSKALYAAAGSAIRRDIIDAELKIARAYRHGARRCLPG